jgi:hypothetical protein
MDGGHAVFCANDSALNLDYLRDVEVAGRTLADGGTEWNLTHEARRRSLRCSSALG